MKEEKAAVAEEPHAPRSPRSPFALLRSYDHFAELEHNRGRFGALPELVEIYHQQSDELAGRLRVQVTTADPLSDALENDIKAALEKATGKQVVLDTSIDASLIGGLVARVEGRVYDASVKNRLEALKHRLITGQVAEA